MSRKPIFWKWFAVFLIVSGCGLVWAGTGLHVSYAAPAVQDEPTQQEGEPDLSNAYCLLCHQEPDRVWELPSGETLSLYVDPTLLHDSVHGEANPEGALNCVDCHVGQRFPHTVPAAQTVREFQLERYATCRDCHEDQYTHAQDSVHGEALRNGHLEAATCVDCHGGHDIQPQDEPRQRISFTCGKCHGVIFEQYRESVHGSALVEDSNPDVPTCIDCHGVHNIENPTTAEFRTNSPLICAQCHANADLMNKYDISTHVFDTYLTDFHGTTVALFEREDPNVATNKAVCFDCHGVHNIVSVEDQGSAEAIRANLLITCQKCHPNATTNFPDAWIGHYPPSLQSTPLLFTVNTFYALLIPGVVGGFILLVFTDIFRRIRQRLFGKSKSGH
ncbi:MAG: cytochrome c3 family protein [Anaerolineae bacterium]|nr:cytochrome c3 family protein [Anaerolineae bacterium]